MALSFTTKLTRKGQTTVPAEFRKELGLKEGDRLIWWEEDGRIRMTSARDYAKRMSENFESQRDPDRTPLTIEELKEARAEAWTHRHTRAAVEQ